MLSLKFALHAFRKSIGVFKKQLLKFIGPSPNSIIDIYKPHGIELLTRLRLGLTHLSGRKFWHGFMDTTDHMCRYRNNI